MHYTFLSDGSAVSWHPSEAQSLHGFQLFTKDLYKGPWIASLLWMHVNKTSVCAEQAGISRDFCLTTPQIVKENCAESSYYERFSITRSGGFFFF